MTGIMEFRGDKMKKILSVLLVFILLAFNIPAMADEPQFCFIYKSVENGQKDVSVTQSLVFEFNLRIDPLLEEITINGSDDMIEKVILTEGKKIEIILKETLEMETEYVLSFAGVRDIYESRAVEQSEIRFETECDIRLISENIDNETGTYRAEVKNLSSKEKKVYIILAVKDKKNGALLKTKVLSQTIGVGETKTFSHTFSGISEDYIITAYDFTNLKSLSDLRK